MRKIAYTIFLLAWAFACTDPYEGKVTPAYDNLPVSSYLESQPEKFSKWVELLNYTGMFSTLNLSANYTCFVPNNQAFAAYMQANGYAAVTDIPMETARLLVKYHTIKGKQYLQSLFDNGAMADSTASGDYLTIEIREGGLNAIYVNGQVRIAELDIEATNGVVHVLDGMLTPVTETIWGKLGAGGFSIFAKAVEMTGMQTALNSIYVQSTNSETGEVSYLKKFYTLFAVPDEVFAAGAIADINALVDTLNAGSDYTSADNALYKYVAYHLLDQQLDFAALATIATSSTNLSTMAVNELINLSEQSGKMYVNYDKTSATGVAISDENRNAKNGIVHVVNNWMPVKLPPITTVTWELTGYSDLASLFPGEYRKSTLSASATKAIEYGSVDCYKWSSIPTEWNNSSVFYFVANKNDAVRYTMVNYDCMGLYLGLYGWIELQSPAVLKGKYTVKLSYYSAASATKHGKVMAILDGSYLGSEVSTHGSSSTTAKIVTTTLGTVTFNGTSTHKLRLLAGDDAMIYLDYVQFVPVQ